VGRTVHVISAHWLTFREWFLTNTTHIAARLDQIVAAGGVAMRHGLRGADALHLVAAMSAQGTAAFVDEFVFATYDLALAKAARETGIFTAVVG
jgi:predicted nucleic acid-binding protein